METLKGMLDFKDKRFYNTLFRLSIPIVLQQALAALLFLLDNIMLGQLGEEAIAASGQASQMYFLMTLFNFGVISGIAIFVAQYWGQKDLVNIRRMQGIALCLMGISTLLFVLVAQFLPGQFMNIYSDDPAVISLGIDYLRWVSIAYIFQAVSQAYGNILRSCEVAFLPMLSAAIGVIVNGVLNYLLIFGKFGFPQLGIAGAGIATSIAAAVDCGIILCFSYIKKTPAAATPKEMRFTKELLISYIKVGWPVVANEILWALGTSAYVVLYGMLGTKSAAAMQIHNTVDRFAFVVTTAVGSAGGIMIGNRIGANEADLAKKYAKRLVFLSLLFGIMMSGMICVGAPFFVSLYKVSDEVRAMVMQVMIVFAVSCIIQSVNYTLMIGILRPGGDTLGSTKCEILTMWLISIPLSYGAGLLFDAPVWVCYASICFGELIKLIAFYVRYRRGNWTRNVTNISEKKKAPKAA